MEYGSTLVAIGGLLLASLALDYVGRRTGIPRVSLLVAFGVAVGPEGADWIPAELRETTDFVAAIALVLVAFLLGGDLELSKLRRHGREILLVSGVVVVASFAVVTGGLVLAGAALAPALLLGAISTATAPAATRSVVRDYGGNRSFSETLLGIVAIDDAWGLILFGLAAGLAAVVGAGAVGESIGPVAWELGGALVLGTLVGVPAAYLTGRIRPGAPSLLEGLGVVLTAGGIALLIDVSFLLTAIVAGAIVVNFARHHERSFREIEYVDGPILVMFFVLAGASLEFDAVLDAGLAGVAYVVFRVLGRFAGGWLGGTLARMKPVERRWIGTALMPQAGIALGMALVAAQEFPEHGDTILAVTIGSTVIFELFGPIGTRLALIRTDRRNGTRRVASDK